MRVLTTYKLTPTKSWHWVVPRANLHMDFTIVQIGDVTSNGNNIVKMQHRVEKDTPLGVMRQSETYYIAVKNGSVRVKVGDSVTINPSDYRITERPFVHPESGEEIMLKWLSLK